MRLEIGLLGSVVVWLAACGAGPTSVADASVAPDAGVEVLPPFDAGLCAQLRAMVSAEVLANHTPGIAFSVRASDGALCEGAAGLTDRDAGTAMSTSTRFRIGSVTKTFIAAVVLQLVDERVISLTDPLSRWLPTFPRGSVTIEQLLNHSSGLVDYLFDPQLQATQRSAHTRDEILAIAARAQSAAVAPGTWSYSNTNYFLLGEIITAATGTSWAQQVRARLLERSDLRLTSTFIAGYEPVPGGVGRGYLDDMGWVDVSDATHPTVLGAAGCMVSTMSDLTQWWRALNGGKVFSAASLAAMRANTVPVAPGQTWGLGVEAQDGAPLGMLLGHGGGLGGYSTQMQFFTGPGLTLAVAMNASLQRGDPLERVDPVTSVHQGIRPRLWQALLGL